MEVDDIKINQAVELVINSGYYQGQYPSKISDIDEKNINVMTPSTRACLIPLRKDDEIDVLFTGDYAAYKYTATVRERVLEPVPQIIITRPDSLERIQRRDYFRLEVKEKVTYCKINQEGEPLGKPEKAITSDLSSGGVRIIIKEEMEPDLLLALNFAIPVIKDISIRGRIVNIYKTSSTIEVGIKFIDIKAKTRDKIMGWLFEKQREWRRKGLL